MSRYICHLRRRNGRTQTELDMHDGGPPAVGTVVNVIVTDETVSARVGSFGAEPSKVAGGDPIIHIYADEID